MSEGERQTKVQIHKKETLKIYPERDLKLQSAFVIVVETNIIIFC
jgi:hypothetical protein